MTDTLTPFNCSDLRRTPNPANSMTCPLKWLPLFFPHKHAHTYCLDFPQSYNSFFLVTIIGFAKGFWRSMRVKSHNPASRARLLLHSKYTGTCIISARVHIQRSQITITHPVRCSLVSSSTRHLQHDERHDKSAKWNEINAWSRTVRDKNNDTTFSMNFKSRKQSITGVGALVFSAKNTRYEPPTNSKHLWALRRN
jgi:hypothetical protein